MQTFTHYMHRWANSTSPRNFIFKNIWPSSHLKFVRDKNHVLLYLDKSATVVISGTLINIAFCLKWLHRLRTETLPLKVTEIIQAISELQSALVDLSLSPLNQQFYLLAENWYFNGGPMVLSTTQTFSSSSLSCSTQHTKHHLMLSQLHWKCISPVLADWFSPRLERGKLMGPSLHTSH